MSVGRWGVGLAASGVAHGALFAGLALAVTPTPPPVPDPAPSEFAVVSYSVARSRAEPSDVTGADVPEAASAGALALTGAIPQSRVAATDVTGDTAGPVLPDEASVAAVKPGGEAARAAPPSGLSPTVQPPDGVILSAKDPGGIQPVADLPLTGRLLDPSVPTFAVVPGATADSIVVRDTALNVRPTPLARTEAIALKADTGTDAPVATQRARGPGLTEVIDVGGRLAAQTGYGARLDSRTGLGVQAAALAIATPPRAADVPDAPVVAAVLRNDPADTPAQLPTDRVATAAVVGQATPPEVQTGTELAGVAAVGTQVPPAPDTQPTLAALPPNTDRQAATLAWSGGAGDAVDALSLAAIQSFSRAGDPDPGAGPPVRDRIGAILANVPCARLQTEFDPDTGMLELRGHLPEEGLRGPVVQALSAQIGPSIPLRDAMLILPRPVCGVLAGIDAVGLPQSDDQTDDPRIIGAVPQSASLHFAEGERLTFELSGPDYPAYFYIDYFDAGGDVSHLQPSATVPLRAIAAKGTETVGSGADGRPAMDLFAAPPFGQEILAAFAASVPLYDGIRPQVEPAARYLDFLRDRVAATRAAHPDFRGEWFYIFVATGP